MLSARARQQEAPAAPHREYLPGMTPTPGNLHVLLRRFVGFDPAGWWIGRTIGAWKFGTAGQGLEMQVETALPSITVTL